MTPPISNYRKNNVSKKITKEILKSLNDVKLNDLDEKDLDKVIKNYLLKNLTSQ